MSISQSTFSRVMNGFIMRFLVVEEFSYTGKKKERKIERWKAEGEWTKWGRRKLGRKGKMERKRKIRESGEEEKRKVILFSSVLVASIRTPLLSSTSLPFYSLLCSSLPSPFFSILSSYLFFRFSSLILPSLLLLSASLLFSSSVASRLTFILSAAGISRSVTLTVAYLMRQKKFPFLDA